MTGSLNKSVLLADYFVGIWVRMLRRNGAVAEDAFRKMANGEYGIDDYMKSVTQVVDGNLLDGIEVAGTLVAGPGFKVASNVRRSAPYSVNSDPTASPDPNWQYRVRLTSRLTRGFGDELPDARVSFESVQGNEAKHCPTGILPAGARQFRLVVDRTDLQSGSYTATAEVIPIAAELADDSKKQTRNVTIEL